MTNGSHGILPTRGVTKKQAFGMSKQSAVGQRHVSGKSSILWAFSPDGAIKLQDEKEHQTLCVMRPWVCRTGQWFDPQKIKPSTEHHTRSDAWTNKWGGSIPWSYLPWWYNMIPPEFLLSFFKMIKFLMPTHHLYIPTMDVRAHGSMAKSIEQSWSMDDQCHWCLKS